MNSTLTLDNSFSNTTPNNSNIVDDGHLLGKSIQMFILLVIGIVGSLGNLTVIFSIILMKKVYQQGNIFVINLAIADLMITGFVIPTVMINVLYPPSTEQEVVQLSATPLCQLTGYIVTVACTCSTNNLMMIAFNRYLAIVHSSAYNKYFSTRKAYLIVTIVWVYSNATVIPTLLGWGNIRYDSKMKICVWNDSHDYTYTYFLCICALGIPMICSTVCYARLFRSAKKTGRWVRQLSRQNGVRNLRSVEREKSLLNTLVAVLCTFYSCWLPYGIMICFVEVESQDESLKRIAGWIALTNSMLNFFIYGAMNKGYRRGYRNLWYLVFRCSGRDKLRQFDSDQIHNKISGSLSNRNSFYSRKVSSISSRKSQSSPLYNQVSRHQSIKSRASMKSRTNSPNINIKKRTQSAPNRAPTPKRDSWRKRHPTNLEEVFHKKSPILIRNYAKQENNIKDLEFQKRKILPRTDTYYNNNEKFSENVSLLKPDGLKSNNKN